MQGIKFNHVIVIGYGVVTGEVLRFVHEKSLQYAYTVEYIEHEVYPFNKAKKYAETESIEYHVIEKKAELLEYFLEKRQGRLLIISASNNYIFPAGLIAKDNVTIVNFHNALLPAFPGRNAPSWAIYEGKAITGITWHYVTDGIDTGDIIIQKELPIDDDIKAYELVAAQMRLASEAFIECFEAVLKEIVQTTKQAIPDDRRVYKSYEVPGQGKFDLLDPVEQIYRLLRAMDYGKNNIFPMPMTQYNGNRLRIRRYKKVKREERIDGRGRLYLTLDDEYLLMLRYEVLKK